MCSDRQATDLFPLPLTPFEWLHYLDDSPEYPATFFGELTFTGEINSAALELAWARALGRHPLLVACVDESRPGPCWIIRESCKSAIDIRPHNVAVEPSPSARIDLRREPGVRLWARSAESDLFAVSIPSCLLRWQRRMRFIADLLLAYAAEVTLPGSLPNFDRLDHQALRAEEVFAAESCRTRPPGKSHPVNCGKRIASIPVGRSSWLRPAP